MNKEKKNIQHSGIGMASVLMIVMVLALTTFGILALVSAYSDHQTSRRVISLTADYYNAEKEMQRQIAEVEIALKKGEDPFSVNGTLDLIEKMGEDRQLHVTLRKKDEDESGIYDIIRYELENISEWSPDNELHIWDGGD